VDIIETVKCSAMPDISENSSQGSRNEEESGRKGWSKKSSVWSSQALQTELLWSHVTSDLSAVMTYAGTDAGKEKTRLSVKTMSGWPHGMDRDHAAWASTVSRW